MFSRGGNNCGDCCHDQCCTPVVTCKPACPPPCPTVHTCNTCNTCADPCQQGWTFGSRIKKLFNRSSNDCCDHGCYGGCYSGCNTGCHSHGGVIMTPTTPAAPAEAVPAPKDQPKKMPATIGSANPVYPVTPVASPRIGVEIQ
jgi:hypothetical protein